VTTVVLNLITIEASNDCLAAICTRCSMVRKVTKRHSATRLVGRKGRPPNQAVASQSAMVQVDLLVPPKHQATRQHFGTAQDVRRDKPVATDDERLKALQTISSQSRKIALIYLKEQKKLAPKVQRKYQSVPHVPSIQPLRLQSETIWLSNQ